MKGGKKMDKRIEGYKTSDLGEFISSLKEGKPIVIYDGYLCGCRSGIRGRKDEVDVVIASSESKIIGGFYCGSEIKERSILREKGKLFVSGGCKTVDEMVTELTRDYQRELACEIFEYIFGYCSDELSESCPFVDMFVDSSDVSESEKRLIYIGGSMRPEVDYHKLLLKMDEAFSEGRIMLLDELSWYFRKGEGEDRRIYLSTSHHKVKGGYCLRGDVVAGRAVSEERFPFWHFDEEFLKPIGEHGLGIQGGVMTYHIDAKVDQEYVDSGLKRTVYTLKDSTEFSLHGDTKRTLEYYGGIKVKVKEALSIRSYYEELIRGILSDS